MTTLRRRRRLAIRLRTFADAWWHSDIAGFRVGRLWVQLWFIDWQPFGEREGLTRAPFTIRLGGTRRLTISRKGKQ